VFPDGSLCLDIIQDKWSPVYSVSTILTSIQVRRAKLHADGAAHACIACRTRQQQQRAAVSLLFRGSFRLICCTLAVPLSARPAESSLRSEQRVAGQSRCGQAAGDR